MGLQSTDTKAQDGQQHPGSDALEIAKPFVDSGGKDVYIYMTDVYRNFPYERTSYAQYQGYMKTEVEQVLTSPYKDHIVLVPYEPDGNWFGGMTTNADTLAAFNAEWLQTYNFIKGLWPQARIAGPNLSWYYPSAFSGFLTFCKTNGCLPDVITLARAGVPSTVRPHVAAYRALEASVGLTSPLPISLNEYAARFQLTNPGADGALALRAARTRRSTATCLTGTSTARWATPRPTEHPERPVVALPLVRLDAWRHRAGHPRAGQRQQHTAGRGDARHR